MAVSLFVSGDNHTRLWGLDARQRITRMARAAKLESTDEPRRAAIVANAAFAFDPAWLAFIVDRRGTMLTLRGTPVLAHVRDGSEAEAVVAAIEREAIQGLAIAPPAGLTIVAAEHAVPLENDALRKREAPFVLRLDADSVAAAERASYAGAYKGVTDLLTKWLWPEWAFFLTRLAARLGLSPNMVTTIGLLFCVSAGAAFAYGQYWLGLATGLVSMVLDTVDGKLARCTITSSRWGNIYDHGIDLIHPPIWWWLWAIGLPAYGTPLPPGQAAAAVIMILVAYVVQRLIEGAFIAGFGMHIHVWHRLDSRFRLITARRNPNWLLLFAAMCVGRPDLGLLALAWWAALCCLFHLVRLAQAWISRWRGAAIISWLAI